MLNESSIMHADSVLGELSTLEHLREHHGKSFVVGPSAGAGKEVP